MSNLSTCSSDVDIPQGWLEGKAGGSPTHCDVRDVAAAHIRAAETPAASGRYIVSHARTSNPAEVGRWLQVRRHVLLLSNNGQNVPCCRYSVGFAADSSVTSQKRGLSI